MSEHDFCRCNLKVARAEAKKNGVKVPKFGGTTFTNIGLGKRVYFLEADGYFSEEHTCCSFAAKAQAIFRLIEEQTTERKK